MFRLATFAVAALLAGAPAYAQDKTVKVDKIFNWATPATPGCAVAVSLRGKPVVNRAYGSADLERDVPLSPNSIFDVGSVRKQFVAAAILLLAEDGRLSLSDDIRKHFPELPDYGHKVTVDHLLTHTSGLRDWTALMPLAGGNADILPLILRQRGLNFAPGEEWAYSNSGYVLLTDLVARAGGMSFAEFTRKRLFEPLGMKTTAYREDMFEVIKNRALAYEKGGTGWKLDMVVGNERGSGSGAILSTASDLVIWNDALMSRRLGAFVSEKLQEPAKLNNGRKLSYARGLNVNHYPGVTLVSHSGGAGGYSTWLGFAPAQELSVAVLCNADAMDTSALAHRVADQFLPPPAGRDPGPVAAPGVDVAGRAGLFFSERTAEPLRLIANMGRLSVGGGPVLVPVSADRFRPQRASLYFRSQDEFELTFRSNDEFELKSMEGRVTRYRRPAPYAPTADDLRAFAGRYESDEIGSIYQMAPGKSGLVMRFEISPSVALDLSPVERDYFEFRGRMTVRFHRDMSGKVVAFDYSHPDARNIRFTRLGERAASAATPAQPPAPPAAASAAPGSPAPRPEGLTGEYELAPGRSVAITLEGGQLHGQPSGGEKRPLVHVSGATYSVADTPLTLTFTLGADGRATGAVMRQNGRERTLPKVR
ncbi:MAG TPA: serine hydrolase [Pyrinomonadaceae bacterium]|jgi:CubicO group peptidase (beta-lactamase class C family)